MNQRIPRGMARLRGVRLLGLLAGLTCAIGLGQAQTTPRTATTALPAPLSQAADPGVRDKVTTLEQLGIDYAITLRGVQGTVGIPFSVRTDEMVQKITLHLRYSYSPALLPDLSHIKVTVNDVTVATLPVPTENAGKLVQSDIEIDPRLATDYNRLNLQLIGHYTRDCEDPEHTSLWASIDRGSSLEVQLQPLALANDLTLLPAPFFDNRDTGRLRLPFVFAGRPDNGLLRAAGTLSSWFGAMAGYRGANFPVSFDAIPDGNAVVLATPRSLPAGIEAPAVNGPTVAMAANPADPRRKLLLVLGRDAAEVQAAASALALGTPLSGAVAVIRDFKPGAARKPYDAPRWVSSDRPVQFGELVRDTSKLNVSGYNPDLIRVGLQLPPDLFVWRQAGIPVDLKYRYTVPREQNQSALNVTINDAFVTTLPLSGRPYAQSVPLRLLDRLRPAGKMPIRQPLLLPLGAFSANSQLRFHYFFDRPKAEECKNTFPDVSASVDADSTVDISGFHHFMAMPNLAAFANAGYPFTRMADLSETAMVMPNAPGTDDVTNLLTVLGRVASSTGYPATNVTVISADDVDKHAGDDLFVLGSQTNQPLFSRWQDKLPLFANPGGRLKLTDWLVDHFSPFLTRDLRRTDLPTVADVHLTVRNDDVVLMGFQSPLDGNRSVVALMTGNPERVGDFFEAWFKPSTLKDFQGSVVLLQDKKLTSLDGNQTYHVGHLPFWIWLQWYFSGHPVLMALGLLLICILLALPVRWYLNRRAAARLAKGHRR